MRTFGQKYSDQETTRIHLLHHIRKEGLMQLKKQ